MNELMVGTEASLDRLYDLLPVIYRERDQRLGGPLRDLLRVIAQQVNVVEEDIWQLYENWFIETCQDWAAPYLGDLVGYEPVHEAGEPGSANTAEARLRNRILIPRRDVARTIQSRRRRGTLPLLEELARDAADWPVRAVEFYRLLAFTQSLNHPETMRGRSVDLRRVNALDLIDGPFDKLAHTADVRGATRGRYNLPNVGLFVWRLKEYRVTQGQCDCLQEEPLPPNAYTFSFLGNDAPLYARVMPETDPDHIADESNLPVPIRRLAFERDKKRYYGPEKSLQIWVGKSDSRGKVTKEAVTADQIIVADLSDWSRYATPAGKVAVDPVLGRILFPDDDPQEGVWASYYYGFSAEMGGGEYNRQLQQTSLLTQFTEADALDLENPAKYIRIYRVGEGQAFDSIEQALHLWGQTQPRQAIIEICDNGVYTDPMHIKLEHGQALQIRAANRRRPIIYLHEQDRNRPEWLKIESDSGGCLCFDGVMIAGRGVRVMGEISELCFRHCTLVPGWGIGRDCAPARPAKASLLLHETNCRVVIEHSILGAIQVHKDEVRGDPIEIRIRDSIVDATSHERDAIGVPKAGVPKTRWPRAHAMLHIARSTIIGQVQAHAIAHAEDSIFTGAVTVTRRQFGCLRFCYVPPDSLAPRRYQCQPDLALRNIAENYPAAEQAALIAAETLRIAPQFTSTRYGTPAYCQLARDCAVEIQRGASDESEMGAFHNLFQPQRLANLRARLNESLPAGMEAGIMFAS